MPPKLEELKVTLAELVKRVNSNASRIKRLEWGMERTNKTVGNLKDALLNRAEELRVRTEQVYNKLAELAKRLDALEAELARLSARAAKLVSKEELSKLEYFIELFSPLSSKFVTKEELKRILRKSA